MILTENSVQNSRVITNVKKAVFYWQEMNEKLEKPVMTYVLFTDKGISEKLLADSNSQAIDPIAQLCDGDLIIAFKSESKGINVNKQ